MRRAFLSLVVLWGTASGLAGCSVPLNGHIGLSVDPQGQLLALVAVCSDNPPDTVHLSSVRSTAGPSSNAAANDPDPVAYETPPGVGRTMSFRLDAPDNGWVARPRPPQLVPDVEYILNGSTNDNSSATKDVRFRLTDRDRLSPGIVLIQEAEGHVESDILITQDEFEDRAKEFC